MSVEIGMFAETGDDSAGTHQAAAEPAEVPQLVFGSAEEFLHEQLLLTYVRDIDDRSAKWCMEWYFHPEAVSRVEALWRAWEHLRLDGATGISVWWRDHADHHMRILLDPQGPFYISDTPRPSTPGTKTCPRIPVRCTWCKTRSLGKLVM